MPRIRQYGHLRVLVGSSSKRNVEYLVDLLSYKGNGKCTCEHFECRLWPVIRDNHYAGTFRPSESTRCKHLRQARRFFMNLIEHPNDPKFLDEVLALWRKRFGANRDEW